MIKISKICLFLAIFLTSSSVAWAGFNYDSVRNYFIIDVGFKNDGDYFLIGQDLSGYCLDPNIASRSLCELTSTWKEELKDKSNNNVTEFFAVSNKLIFINPASKFTDASREMDVDSFETEKIEVNSDQVFTVQERDTAVALDIEAGNIIMHNNFVANNGLKITNSAVTLTPGSIFTNTVYAGVVKLLPIPETGYGELDVSSLKINGSDLVKTDNVYIGSDPICKIVSWTNENNKFNATQDAKEVTSSLRAGPGDQKVSTSNCPPGGGSVSHVVYSADFSTQLACCPTNYFVYNIDVDETSSTGDNIGIMICCQAK